MTLGGILLYLGALLFAAAITVGLVLIVEFRHELRSAREWGAGPADDSDIWPPDED